LRGCAAFRNAKGEKAEAAARSVDVRVIRRTPGNLQGEPVPPGTTGSGKGCFGGGQKKKDVNPLSQRFRKVKLLVKLLQYYRKNAGATVSEREKAEEINCRHPRTKKRGACLSKVSLVYGVPFTKAKKEQRRQRKKQHLGGGKHKKNESKCKGRGKFRLIKGPLPLRKRGGALSR